jgi:tRNA threonylcarbamoyladenosine biosynthesis protein TsaE
MKKIEFSVTNISDLPKAVEWVLSHANGRKKIMLYGQMGAGKTTFTKAFCQYFGVTDNASSPTFSLANDYIYYENDVEKHIYHLDLYRLKTTQEAMDIGIENYLFDTSYCLIEWPQIIEPLLDEGVMKISIEISSKKARKIVIL